MNLLSLITYYAEEVSYTGSNDAKLFGVSINTWVTIGTTLFVVFFSLFIKHFYDEFQKKIRIKNLKTYYLTSVELYLEPVSRQIEKLNDFVSRIDSYSKEALSLESDTEYNLLDLSSANSKEVLEYFISEHKASKERFKQVRNLRAKVDKLDRLKQHMEKMFEEFVKRYSAQEDKWQKDARQMRILHDKFFTIAKAKDIKPGEDGFIDVLVPTFDAWVALGKKGINIRQPNVVYAELISKMKKASEKFMDRPDVFEYFTLMTDLESDFQEIDNTFSQYKKVFEKIRVNMSRTKDQVTDLIGLLS